MKRGRTAARGKSYTREYNKVGSYNIDEKRRPTGDSIGRGCEGSGGSN